MEKNKKQIPPFRCTGTGLFATTFPNGYTVQVEFMIDPKTPGLNGPATSIFMTAPRVAVMVLDRRDQPVTLGTPDPENPEAEGIVTDALGYLAILSSVARYAPVLDDELCLAAGDENPDQTA